MTEIQAECQLCIKERVKAGEAPNTLHILDRAIKEDGLGRVCIDCDGGALKLATRESDV